MEKYYIAGLMFSSEAGIIQEISYRIQLSSSLETLAQDIREDARDLIESRLNDLYPWGLCSEEKETAVQLYFSQTDPVDVYQLTIKKIGTMDTKGEFQKK